METNALIDTLSGDLRPVPPGVPARRIAMALSLGAVGSLLLMLAWLGIRPDLAAAVSTPMFWVKAGYTAAVGLILAVALTRLSRPGTRLGGLAILTFAPLLVMTVMAVGRLMRADAAARMPLIMGDSAQFCPWRIAIVALPLLVAAIWSVRGLAPTRPVLTGLVAGGCAGGLGAAIYALACGETAAPFVAIWYTLGIGVAALLGAVAGSRWLRWR